MDDLIFPKDEKEGAVQAPNFYQETIQEVSDLQAPTVPTPEARREAAEQYDQEFPEQSFGELFVKGAEQDWITSSLGRLDDTAPEAPADPDFTLLRLDKDQEKALFEGLDPELHDEYREAASYEHALKIRENLDTMQKLAEDMNRAGFKGVSARILANVLDPAAVALTAATEGAAAPWVFAAKTSRLARTLKAAGVGAAGNMGVEGILASANPYMDGTDVILAGTIGALFGGGIGALVPNSVGWNTQAKMEAAANDAMKGTRHNFRVDEDENVAWDKVQPTAPMPGSVGAALNPRAEDYLTAEDEALKASWAASRPAKEDVKLQFDLYAELARSDHDGIAAVADLLTPNPSGVRTRGQAQTETAWERTIQTYHQVYGRYRRSQQANYEAWAKEQGLNRFVQKNLDEFNRQVGLATRQDVKGLNKHIQAQVEVGRRERAEMLRMLQEHKVEGFENVDQNPYYITRRYNLKRFEEMRAKMGDAYFTRFLADAIKSGARKNGGEPIEDDRATVIAEGLRQAIYEGKYGVDGQISRDTLKETLDTASDVIGQRLGKVIDVDEDLEDELHSALTGLIRGQEPTPARAKRRVSLDETYMDTNGNRITDFLENDAEQLDQQYFRQMSGLIGMARMGIKGDSDWASLDRRLRKTAGAYGLDPSSSDSAVKDLAMLKDMILGRPLHDPNRFMGAKRAARLARSYNFARLMGVVGFAQIAELGNVFTQAGLDAAIKQVPEFRKQLRRLRETGEWSDELSEDIEAGLGIGVERMIMDRSGQYDDLMTPEMGRFNEADRALSKINRAVGDISGMNPITSQMDRMAARVIIQRLASNALGGAKQLSKQRMLSLGIEPEMAERIYDNMRRNAKWTEGSITGKKVAGLNLASWEPEVADALAVATQRFVRRAVQKNDPGDLPKFMSSEWARIIFQFRSFTMNAWAKQLLHGVRMRDAETLQSFMATSFFGGIAYLSMISAQSVGKPDREEWLAERLTPDKIAAAAFYRAGWASLIPGMMDTALWTVGQDPVFSFARATGTPSDAFWGNPTIDLMNTGFRATRGIAKGVTGGEMDTQDWRSIARLAAFQNALVIGNGLDYLSGKLGD